MRFLGFDIKNQKIMEDFEAGIVNAVGSMFVYSIVIAILFVWYRSSRQRRRLQHRQPPVADAGPTPYM